MELETFETWKWLFGNGTQRENQSSLRDFHIYGILSTFALSLVQILFSLIQIGENNFNPQQYYSV